MEGKTILAFSYFGGIPAQPGYGRSAIEIAIGQRPSDSSGIDWPFKEVQTDMEYGYREMLSEGDSCRLSGSDAFNIPGCDGTEVCAGDGCICVVWSETVIDGVCHEVDPATWEIVGPCPGSD